MNSTADSFNKSVLNLKKINFSSVNFAPQTDQNLTAMMKLKEVIYVFVMTAEGKGGAPLEKTSDKGTVAKEKIKIVVGAPAGQNSFGVGLMGGFISDAFMGDVSSVTEAKKHLGVLQKYCK